MIPKIMHFIWWQGFENIPKKYRVNVDDWVKNNPSYELYVWDQKSIEDMSNEYFPEYKENFKKSNQLVEQVDIAKFMILDIYGGFYIDTDVECRLPIPEEWLNYSAIFTEQNGDYICDNIICVSSLLYTFGYSPKKIYNNGFFAGVANNGIFSDLLQKCISLRENIPRFFGKEIYILYTAGPGFLSMYISKYLLNRDDVLILDPTYIESCGIAYVISRNESDCLITDKTVGIHKYANSWISSHKSFLINGLYHWVKISLIILIIILIVLYFKNRI